MSSAIVVIGALRVKHENPNTSLKLNCFVATDMLIDILELYMRNLIKAGLVCLFLNIHLSTGREMGGDAWHAQCRIQVSRDSGLDAVFSPYGLLKNTNSRKK